MERYGNRAPVAGSPNEFAWLADLLRAGHTIDEAEAALWKIVTDFRRGQLDKIAVLESRVQTLEAAAEVQKEKMKEVSKENLELKRRKNQLDSKIRRLEAQQKNLRTQLRYAPYAPPPHANAVDRDEGISVEATEVVVDNDDGYYSDDQVTAVAAMAAPRSTPKRGRPRGSNSRATRPRARSRACTARAWRARRCGGSSRSRCARSSSSRTRSASAPSG